MSDHFLWTASDGRGHRAVQKQITAVAVLGENMMWHEVHYQPEQPLALTYGRLGSMVSVNICHRFDVTTSPLPDPLRLIPHDGGNSSGDTKEPQACR